MGKIRFPSFFPTIEVTWQKRLELDPKKDIRVVVPIHVPDSGLVVNAVDDDARLYVRSMPKGTLQTFQIADIAAAGAGAEVIIKCGVAPLVAYKRAWIVSAAVNQNGAAATACEQKMQDTTGAKPVPLGPDVDGVDITNSKNTPLYPYMYDVTNGWSLGGPVHPHGMYIDTNLGYIIATDGLADTKTLTVNFLAWVV